MQFKRAIACLVCFSTLVLSCGSGKSKQSVDTSVAADKSEQGSISSDLSAQVQEVQSGKYAGDCDRKFKDAQIAITRELDNRFNEIQALMSDSETHKDERIVKAGQITMREFIKRPDPRHSAWSEDRQSWAYIIRDYEKIKNTPTSRDWVNLSIDTKSILAEDRDRVNGYSQYLRYDSEPKIQALATIVDSCSRNETCKQLEINDPDLLDFLSYQPTYGKYLKRISKSNQSRPEFLSGLADFKSELMADLLRYSMRINPSVKRTSPSTFELSFDGSAFPEDALFRIQSYVESAWKSASYQVKLVWTPKTPNTTDLFKFILHQEGGARSYVLFQDQEVHLFSGIRSTSVAHEFGHVLGFKDHYYTYWVPNECAYYDQVLETDIMSYSETGSVTGDEWKELDRTYPFASGSDS